MSYFPSFSFIENILFVENIYFGLREKEKTHKLLPWFDVPYQIIKKLDSVTYRVKREANYSCTCTTIIEISKRDIIKKKLK